MRLLDAVLRKGLPLEAALDIAARDLAKPEDRGLAHAIAAEALRHLPDLDALIDSAAAKPLPPDSKARFALRIALVQALALDTPPHAAISTVLPLVDGGPRRLVHGIFGTLMRKRVSLPSPPALPAEIEQRWSQAWGRDVVEAASAAIAAPPRIDIAFPLGSSVELEGEALMPGHLRLPRGVHVPDLTGYGSGRWWVQDISASIPARLLGDGRGRTALDLCAAPGGKTMQLAAAGYEVTAVDISESRLARLLENLQRTGLQAKVVAADAMKWAPAEQFDAILIDAPCSATGIFRRHPDVLHRVRPAAVAALVEAQAAMLARAAEWLKPGGCLVYSVCSLEPQEGEAVADGFLDKHPEYAVKPIRAGEIAEGMQPGPQGFLRILPGTLAEAGGCDSFFIARFVRT